MRALKLLLVEDDRRVATGLIWALSDNGHTVVHTDSGRPVLGLIFADPPDAIILDISLPDLDGLEVGRSVRAIYPLLPIIFATGHDERFRGLNKAIADPMSVYLQKPFSVDALEDVLRRLVPALRQPLPFRS
jgi:DNA-binding response OmpR family regulator